MPTETNARLNLQTAARNVRGRMGLSDVPADWTYDQRIAYNKALAAEIQQYPNSFTPEILVTADKVAKTSYQSLEDSSIAWGDFAADAGLNLGGIAVKALYVFAAVAAVAVVVAGVAEYRKRRAGA